MQPLHMTPAGTLAGPWVCVCAVVCLACLLHFWVALPSNHPKSGACSLTHLCALPAAYDPPAYYPPTHPPTHVPACPRTSLLLCPPMQRSACSSSACSRSGPPPSASGSASCQVRMGAGREFNSTFLAFGWATGLACSGGSSQAPQQRALPQHMVRCCAMHYGAMPVFG